MNKTSSPKENEMKLTTTKTSILKTAIAASAIAGSIVATPAFAEISIQDLEHANLAPYENTSNVPTVTSLSGMGVGAVIGGIFGGPAGAIIGGVGGLAVADNEHNSQALAQANIKAQDVESQLQIAQLELKNAKMILKEQEERQSIQLASLQNDIMRREATTVKTNETMSAISSGFTMAVQFRSDSFKIEQHYKKQLTKLASSLNTLSKIEVELSGFTDPRGNTISNLELSRKRVEEVKKVLVDAGVAKERITASSLGEGELMCTMEDTKGYQFERRVEISFRFLTEEGGGRIAQN